MMARPVRLVASDYSVAFDHQRHYRYGMPISDLDIARAAHQWIVQHGENATAKAREMVEQMRRKGDDEGADTWLRIIVAIGTLGAPPTESRH
jgi:hypothetical protein